MGVRDWVRRVEDEFFHRLEADQPRQAKYALVSGIGFFVVSLGNLFIGAATGNWLHFLLAVGLAVGAVLGVRNWWRLRGGSNT